MERKNIMLSFRGEMTDELLGAILNVMETKLSKVENCLKARKRVFNVLVECMQNLYHHNENTKTAEEGIEQVPSGIVMVAENEEGYSVVTGNIVTSVSAQLLGEKLRQVNNMSRDELKMHYQKILANGKRSDKGGGGLGIIDIARKSGKPLQYGFVPYGKVNQFFSLNVIVNN
jgi:hypothetical protein